ncbi:MAG: hypothetical protein ACE5Q6_21310 [Dehalococcoidia bacterium]
MLWSVSNTQVFADYDDRVGVIEAPSLTEAVEVFLRYNEEVVDYNDYTRGGHSWQLYDNSPEPLRRAPTLTAVAEVVLQSTDPEGVQGADIFHISYLGKGIATWLMSDQFPP